MRHLGWLPIVGVLSMAVPVQAMPLTEGMLGPGSALTFVRDGCGPFAHRSHYGYCKEDGDGGYGYGRRDVDGGYGPGGYGRGPRFFGDGGYRERRCFFRETDDGPVRVCR